jgi:glycine cleavage system transcriptional repressor
MTLPSGKIQRHPESPEGNIMADFMLLSISGRDRPGIVRDVAEALLGIQANIEDSSMTALRGRFTMMLIVGLPEAGSLAALRAALADLEQRTGLTLQSQVLSPEEVAAQAPTPDCVVTVSGADKPGIVHAVAECLADDSIAIVDLSTRTMAAEGGEMYMMAMEVHAGDQIDGLATALNEISRRIHVDIEVHKLETNII